VISKIQKAPGDQKNLEIQGSLEISEIPKDLETPKASKKAVESATDLREKVKEENVTTDL
jgi:hypothetical protein